MTSDRRCWILYRFIERRVPWDCEKWPKKGLWSPDECESKEVQVASKGEAQGRKVPGPFPRMRGDSVSMIFSLK